MSEPSAEPDYGSTAYGAGAPDVPYEPIDYSSFTVDPVDTGRD